MSDESEIKVDTGQEEPVKDTTTQEGTAAAENQKATTSDKEAEAAASSDSKDGTQGAADSQAADAAGENSTEKDKKGFFSHKKDKEKEAMQEKINALQDRVTRQMAEFDNYRKRTEKEKELMFSNGESSVLEKMLPIVDNFERGFDTVTEEDKDDAFVLGMHKVYDQLVKQLKDLGVTEMDAEGKDFDPQYHNAVMQVDSDKYESGKVAQELQKGYLYHGRVLRHAMVSVVK